jgi:copper chaperone CopZ
MTGSAHLHPSPAGIIYNNWVNEMSEFTLRIDGMHCGSCVKRVSQALATVPGATVEEVRLGAARFSAPAEDAPVDHAIAALSKAGYTARLDQ